MDIYRSAQCFLSRNPYGILPIRPGRPRQQENKILSNSTVLCPHIPEKLSQLHLLINNSSVCQRNFKCIKALLKPPYNPEKWVL